MNCAAPVLAMLMATPSPLWVTYDGFDGPGAGRHVVLVSGDEEYRSEEALPQLGQILAVRNGFTCTVLFAVDPETGEIDPENRENIPGLEALEDADLMIIATRFRDLPDEQMKHVDAYLRAGKPVVGLRTATHGFAMDPGGTYGRYAWNHEGEDYEQGFGRQVLGETWIAHHGAHGSESTRGVVPESAADHPIARGLEPGAVWGPTDVYRVRLPLTGDGESVVLGAVLDGMSPDDEPVDGPKNDPMMPVAWTRTYAGDDGARGRVFATTMGAATDLEAEGTRRMIVNGVYWALGMEDRIPEGGADVRIVGAYDPSDFSFGGHRKGVEPADHALPSGGAGLFRPGDHVVVIGNTFAERMAQSGYLEALLHAAHPDHALVVRQVPWSADEVGMRPREMNVPTMEDHLARQRADVVVMCFGMSESFGDLDGFRPALDTLLDRLPTERIVMISPVRHEDLGDPWPSGRRHNARLAEVVGVMRDVARRRSIELVDLFGVESPSDRPLTSNGIHPTEYGCFVYTREIGRQLGLLGAGSPTDADVAAADELRRIACDKHYQFRLLYRPTNTEYVFGRRHEPYGVVNFPPEMAQLERMVAGRERAMWAMDKPSPASLFAEPPGGRTVCEGLPLSRAFPEDTWTPAPVEAKGRENSLGSLDIEPPDEFAMSFDVADGYLIECFASEQDFAELANPLAMAFDGRGRLWVLCTPTYPHLLPGAHPECKLIILEDVDGDGRADRRTVFADRLYIPTGFAIDVDAVYLGQAPDLLKLTDEDGDDVADRREIVLSGFGMCDSHHTISAFEWDPNGGFLMHEGVFTKSNIETPYGTRRGDGAAVWRFDPRTQRLEILSHPYYNNPWGHAFDDFGQSVLADASGGDNYCFSQVITAFDFPYKPRKPNRFLHRGRPTAGCEIIASRHFPDDAQGSFLVNQSIGYHGTRWDRLIREGSGWRAERMPQDLLKSSDTNFRPVAMEIGPDGALYIADWCNPLIGHMQYSVRDPRRDHAHGRIWRVRHAERPLVEPPDVAGASIPGLVEMLRLPERNTRQVARRRLQRAPMKDVLAAMPPLGAGDGSDPLHDRLQLEALWLRQAWGVVEPGDLLAVVQMDDPAARAGALRVLRHLLQTDDVDHGAVRDVIERAVADPDMRVRLEGAVACGFVRAAYAADLAASVTQYPMDEGLRVAVEETLIYLDRRGDSDSEVVRRLRLERLPTDKLLEEPLDEVSALAILSRPDVAPERRSEAIALIAGPEPRKQAVRLAQELDDAWRPDAAMRAIGPMLLAMPSDAIEPLAHRLTREAASADRDDAQLATALLMKHGHAYEAADRAVVPGALGWLEPGDAPAEAVSALRRDVDRGEVDPAPAIEQIVRHNSDRDELYAWLATQVDAVDHTGLHRWNGEHETAMAALRGMHLVDDDPWPDGYDDYRQRAATPEELELGRRIYFDDARGCARCHGEDGRGLAGFPPLDRSPWVLGRPERAAGIVIHGLSGRLQLHDGAAFESAMAPLGDNLGDEEIAAVLTWVRRSWGNFAAPVTVENVARARRAAPRSGMWEVKALQTAYPLYHDRILASRTVSRPPAGMPARTVIVAIAMFAVPAVVLIGVLAIVFRMPGLT